MAEVPTDYMCAVTIMEEGRGLLQNREGKEEHCSLVVEARGVGLAPLRWPWWVFLLNTTGQPPGLWMVCLQFSH